MFMFIGFKNSSRHVKRGYFCPNAPEKVTIIEISIQLQDIDYMYSVSLTHGLLPKRAIHTL